LGHTNPPKERAKDLNRQTGVPNDYWQVGYAVGTFQSAHLERALHQSFRAKARGGEVFEATLITVIEEILGHRTLCAYDAAHAEGVAHERRGAAEAAHREEMRARAAASREANTRAAATQAAAEARASEALSAAREQTTKRVVVAATAVLVLLGLGYLRSAPSAPVPSIASSSKPLFGGTVPSETRSDANYPIAAQAFGLIEIFIGCCDQLAFGHVHIPPGNGPTATDCDIGCNGGALVRYSQLRDRFSRRLRKQGRTR